MSELVSHSIFFDDLDTFFRARKLRQRDDGSWLEDSYDFGVHWLDDEHRQYRLTWIGNVHRDEGDGGELYLVCLTPTTVYKRGGRLVAVIAGSDSGIVELLCVIPPVGGKHPDTDAEDVIRGWGDACGTPRSINWIRERVAQAIATGEATAP